MTATRRTGVARRDGARPSSIAPSLARFARSPESGREKKVGKRGAGPHVPSSAAELRILNPHRERVGAMLAYRGVQTHLCNEAGLSGNHQTSNPFESRPW